MKALSSYLFKEEEKEDKVLSQELRKTRRETKRRTAIEATKQIIAIMILDRTNTTRKSNEILREMFIVPNKTTVYKTRKWAMEVSKWMEEQGLEIVAK